jgi:hypothetical protein
MLYWWSETFRKTNQAPGRLDKRSVDAVHLVVESARVAEIVPGAVPPPQRRRDGSAVDALSPVGAEVNEPRLMSVYKIND